MKSIKNENIEYYDEETMNLIGSTEKKFVRIDSNCLKKYLEIAIKPSTSYVTYIDDFVKENYNPDTHEIPLKYVSVLLKKRRWKDVNDTVFKEEIGSRIANAVGLPTVYNELIKYNQENYVMSIDFVKTGQEINSFERENDKQDHAVSNYDFWEKFFNEKTIKLFGYNPNLVENIIKLKRDFVSHFLLRNVIFDDGDFCPKNVTLIKDLKTGNIELAPINDYEFIFNGRKEDYFDEDVKKYIDYISKKYPQELKDFADRIDKSFYKNGVLQENVLKDLVHIDELDSNKEKEFFEQFKKNIIRFMHFEKVFENSQEERKI